MDADGHKSSVCLVSALRRVEYANDLLYATLPCNSSFRISRFRRTVSTTQQLLTEKVFSVAQEESFDLGNEDGRYGGKQVEFVRNVWL